MEVEGQGDQEIEPEELVTWLWGNYVEVRPHYMGWHSRIQPPSSAQAKAMRLAMATLMITINDRDSDSGNDRTGNAEQWIRRECRENIAKRS